VIFAFSFLFKLCSFRAPGYREASTLGWHRGLFTSGSFRAIYNEYTGLISIPGGILEIDSSDQGSTRIDCLHKVVTPRAVRQNSLAQRGQFPGIAGQLISDYTAGNKVYKANVITSTL
jgi:hypothetical protein